MFAASTRSLGTALTPLPRPLEEARLVEHGLYRSLRHPIYVGLLLAALGWSLLFESPISLAASGALAVVLDLKARREEAWLLERYPGYADYRRRTRRFVPRLY